MQAAGEVLRRGLSRLTLLGDPEEIEAKAKQLRVDLSGADVVFPAEGANLDKYTDLLFGLRKEKVRREEGQRWREERECRGTGGCIRAEQEDRWAVFPAEGENVDTHTHARIFCLGSGMQRRGNGWGWHRGGL